MLRNRISLMLALIMVLVVVLGSGPAFANDEITKTIEEWLAVSNLSRAMLIRELGRQGHGTDEEIIRAIDDLNINWKDMALKQARDINKVWPFSKKGTEKQLEHDLFTKEEIAYAMERLDINWKNNAVRAAREVLKESDYSKEELIEELQEHLFTLEEAIYAADNHNKTPEEEKEAEEETVSKPEPEKKPGEETSSQTQEEKKEETKSQEEKKSQLENKPQEGGKLPKTSSNRYNFLAIGLATLVVGLFIYKKGKVKS